MIRPWTAGLVTALATAAPCAWSQPAHLVRDLATQPATGGPSPTRMIVAGGRLFFAGTDEANGTEPWTSDGTAAGTHLVADLAPGSSGARDFVEMNGLAYFVAADPGRGVEIWRSDGTVAGTFPATDLANTGNPQSPTPIGATLYFALFNDAAFGAELWKTDGTPAGTVLVRDIAPGPDSSSPRELVAAGSTLFFTALNPASGQLQLWKSDGTAAGTVPLGNGPNGPLDPRRLTAVGGTVFFEAHEPVHGYELWKSDGTEAGTVLVRDIYPGAENAFPEELTAVGSLLYFKAGAPGSGYEIWKSDGTAAGTTLVADLVPGDGSSFARLLVAVGSRVFFWASPDGATSQLWVSDGTPAGTHFIAGLDPVESGRGVAVGDRYFFTALTAQYGYELWTSDGTPAGTRIVADIVPGDQHSVPNALVAWAGSLYFTASTADGLRPLWRTDGTAAGTVAIGPTPALSASSSLVMTGAARNSLLFGQPPGGLWLSDGTEAGTTPLPSVPPPCVLPLPADELFFSGSDDSFGSELWATDGSIAGTCRVTDVAPGSAESNVASVTTVGARVFFQDVPYGGAPSRLFVADRIVPVPSFVANVPPIDEAAAFKDELVFVASSDVWASDGSASGTRKLSTAAARGLMPTPSLLYFVAFGLGAEGRELWKTDGTPAGTSVVADICPGLCDAFPNQPPPNPIDHAAVGDILYFVADDGTHGREIWRTDGTAAGTTRLTDLAAPFGAIGCLTELAGALLFCADDGVTGLEVWRSDGTTAGTARLVDIDPGVGFGVPFASSGQFYRAGGLVYFVGYTRALGFELWRTDGTAAGTQPLQDVSPGAPSSMRFALQAQAAGNQLFFVADDGQHGRELWATGLAPALAVGDATVVEGDAGTATALVEVRATGAPAGVATVAYVTAGGTAQAGADYTAASGTLTFLPGGPIAQTVAVAVAGDLAQELDETFELRLSAPSGIGVGRGRGTVVILDDDEPLVAVTDASVAEGDTGDTQALFEVSLTTADGAATVLPTGVAYDTSAITASSSADYVETTGSVTFPAGSASGATQTVGVTVHGDVFEESDETFDFRLTPLTAASAQGTAIGRIEDDDGAPDAASLGLGHGSAQLADLAAQAGPSADTDWYTLAADIRSSYEVVVDGVSGDVLPLTLELMNEQGSLPVKVAVPVGTGSARSLRFDSATPLQRIRVRSGGCGTGCGADDTYRIRAYDTSYAIPRIVRSESLASAVVVQNRTDRLLFAEIDLWRADGTLLSGSGYSLPPHGSVVAPVTFDMSGSATVTHDGGYGALAGKAVTVDLVTGASYDTPMEPRRR